MNLREGTGTALVTGASEGIGLALAKCFAREGHDLVLVARDEDKLRRASEEISSTYAVRVVRFAQDLSGPEAAQRVFDEVQRQKIAIDFLVNNAGAGSFGLFSEMALERQLRMMQLNMVAVTALTRLFLPEMLKRRRGGILNVASTAAFQPGPLMAVYYATKAYVLSFSEALSNELRGSGVTASVLCPGPTWSGFQKGAGMESSRLFRHGVMKASDVAEIAYREFRKGKTTIIPGLRNKILAFGTRLSPRKLLPMIVRLMQDAVREPSKPA